LSGGRRRSAGRKRVGGMDVIVELSGIHKAFGRKLVLSDLNLSVKAGEFVTLLGPSGCGKSTTLNLIAGFVRPDRGVVAIRGRPVNDVEPRRRGLGMVFQNWALFPHMSVFENVAFGLRVRGRPLHEIRRKVHEMLALVRLPGIEDMYPWQLSGGMQQRVALARALAIDPDILLLDEPLSNLDAALRKEMQVELKRLHEQLGITTIFVTHHQEEALVMSDRIAVMHQGRIVRMGPPHDLYRDPRSRFVCTFLGDANIFEGEVGGIDGQIAVVNVKGLQCQVELRPDGYRPRGTRLTLALRPELVKLRLQPAGADNSFAGRVKDVVYKGSNLSYYVDLGPLEILIVEAATEAGMSAQKGDRVFAEWRASAFSILDED
jgi:ABC-type Fe3+/spermidine/putrescine transport system ATPase subunit